MEFEPLKGRGEIRRAYEKFREIMTGGIKPVGREVGWPGGHEPFKLYWRKQEGIWSIFEPKRRRHGYWCAFGTDDPTPATKSLSITCEINPPWEVDRRYAGVFLRDVRGTVYIGHSGKIGGPRPGVNKSTFMEHYRGDNWGTVAWPKGKKTEVVVIGALDDKDLPALVAEFVREVKRIKDLVSGKPKPPVKPSFTPEFSGPRKRYRHKGEIASRCDHSLVVSELARQVERLGLAVANDRERDLLVYTGSGKLKILFEVKTDLTTSSVYQAVGQLMIHGATEKPVPKRVMVLPGKARGRARSALDRLGIVVLSYKWGNGKPTFPGLSKVVP